jgi:hypothetical protein
MPNRSRTTKDLNQAAYSIVQRATAPKKPPDDSEGKNPAAVALGRLGGLKGGAARARKLSKKRRAEIAQKAAKTRWKGHKKPGRKSA